MMSLLDQQEEFEDIWKSLQAEGEVAGDSRRRLSQKRFYIIRKGRTGIPILQVVGSDDAFVKFDNEDMKATEQFDVRAYVSDNGRQTVEIELKDLLYEDIFVKFATNAVSRIRRLEENQEAAQALVRRLRTWKNAFKGQKPVDCQKPQIGSTAIEDVRDFWE